jgi:cyclophilin family peptidyl-prolyl cis-trans isomerase
MSWTLGLLFSIAGLMAGPHAAHAVGPQDEPAAQESADTAAPTQEPGPEAAANQAAGEKSLDDLLTQWGEMDKRLRELETAARADDASDDARSSYRSLVQEAYALFDQIQAAAQAAVAKDPNDEKAAKVLIGIMIDASGRTDGDQKALAIADALMQAGVSVDLLGPALSSNRLTPFGKDLFNEVTIRFKEHAADDLPRIKLTTTKGDIVLELFENEAPNTVANFISLVKKQFYDGLVFHRVIDGFMAQGGCPQGTGMGGPGYTIKCECGDGYPNQRKHYTGSLSMAHAGRDSGGSQFFLTFKATSHLDGAHTAFGRVISGIDVLEKLNRNASESGPIAGVEADKIITAEVVRDRGHEYVPNKIEGSTGAN